jgi:ribose transport system substrate-binding protein
MKKKLLAVGLALILIVGAFAACGGSKDEDSSGSDAADSGDTASGGIIAVLVPSADHGWTGAVLNYAKEKASSMEGQDVSAKVYAAKDAKEQQQQIDDLLAESTPPAGIVILPYDNTLESAMAKVAASDIPFVMFDRIIDNPTVQDKVVANVKGDNEGIGLETAKRFTEKGLNAGDKVYVMIGDTSSVPEMRNAGFQQGLKDAGWTDEQLAGIEYSKATGWSRAEGKQIFIDWINGKTVDEINQYHFIFTHDDELGMGILEALSGSEIEESKKEAFLTSVTSLASSSGLNEMYDVLKGAHTNAAYPDLVKNFDLFSVTYDPAMIQQAVDDMVKKLNGESVEKDDTIKVSVVDSTNVNEFKGF